MSEGFRQAGFHILAAVDSDSAATETQKYNHSRWKHYPTCIINNDINNTKEISENIKNLTNKKIDVIIGGPPCQGFSLSNSLTRKIDNPVNMLFEKFLDVVNIIKPYVFVLENVPGIKSFNQITDKVINSIKLLGYNVEKETLNAADYCVPQIRKRVFFIGTKDKASISFPDNTNNIKYVSVYDAISDLPSLRNGNIMDKKSYKTGNGLNSYQKKMRTKDVFTVQNNLVTRNSDLVLERYAHIKQGENWQNIPDRIMKNYSNKNKCHSGIYRRLVADMPSVTISNYRKNMLIHPFEDRGLSVREAARIQSFPDNYIFRGYLGQQQQQVANAVPPFLAKAVAKEVKKLL